MDEVAVVGIGCRLPGPVSGPEELWEFLMAGGDAVGDVPPDRWRWEAFYDPDPVKPGRMPVRRGAFLEQRIEELDAAFFGIAPREAAQLDPQQRLLLEVSWEALEDAGLDVWSLRGSATSVHVGAFMLDNLLQRAEPDARDHIGPQTAMTCTNTVLASRLSYFYDFRGPSMTIDTACSSSLVAVHQAVRALAGGECTLALAAGVSRIFRPDASLMMAKGQFLAPDGRSKSFSARADGYGRGEGCGVVVLKSLARALGDGDRIYAVIEGTGVNQDGRTDGPAVPSTAAQAALVASVLDRAGVDPATVDFVEAHGTGTPVGDPVEMAALGEVVGRAAGRSAPLLVGSVKAGIGHLEGAAGVAGLIKAALVAQRGVVPPQAWFDELNPAIDVDALGLQVVTEPTELRRDRPRRVAVNSFGYGGTNAHAVLREPPRSLSPVSPATMPSVAAGFFPPVAVVSGHTDGAVVELARSYAGLLTGKEGPAADDLRAALSARTAHEHRAVVVGDDATGVLAAVGRGEQHPDVVRGRARAGQAAAPAFVFSGMGPQWWGMGRELLTRHDGFRALVERCDETFVPLAGWSLLAELGADQATSRMTHTAVAQPASFVLQIGIAAVLAEVGVTPGAVVGHSLGELAAAHTAGCIDLDDALTIAYHRARLLATTAGVGGMLATELGEEEALAIIAPHLPAVSIAAVNSSSATTLSGDVAALEKIEQELTDRGLFHRWLPVEVAYHSPAMDPVLPELRECWSTTRCRPARLPVYSTVVGMADDAARDVDYWVANTRDAVLFDAAARRMLDDGHRVFLEIGAHPVLGLYLHQLVGATPGTKVVPTLHRSRPDSRTLTESLAVLWTHGVSVDWGAVVGRRDPGRGFSLPLYPWQREEHWQEPTTVRRSRVAGRTADPSDDALAGQLVSSAPTVHEVDLSSTTLPWCRRHRVAGAAVFPAAGFLEAVAAHARTVTGADLPLVIEDLVVDRPLVLTEHEDPVLRLVSRGVESVEVHSRGRSDDHAWRSHARARLAPGRYAVPGAPVEPGPVQADIGEDEVYRRLAALGLDYQGPFRSVRRVCSDDADVRVELELDGPVPGGYSAYPPLLDAGLHGALAVVAGRSEHAFVPVRIGRAVLHDRLPSRCQVRAVVRRDGDSRLDVDVWFHDPAGRCVAELRHVELRPLPPADERQGWLDQRTYELRWVAVDDPRPPARPAERWLVVADAPTNLPAALPDAATVTVSSLTGLDDGDGIPACDVLAIDVGGAEASARDAGYRAGRTAELVRRLAEVPAGQGPAEVVFVTESATAVGPADRVGGWTAGWVGGFRRAVANEVPHVRFRHVDHDGHDGPALVAALTATTYDEVAVRGTQLHRPEVAALPVTGEAASWWAVAGEVPGDKAENHVLTHVAGTLQGATWVTAERRAPAAGEIELRVDAVGLNYKDLLKQLGALDPAMLDRTFVGHEPGMEACVVVERVGENAEGLSPGGRYAAAIAGGCFRRYVTVPFSDVRLLPADPAWTDAETAGLLVAFGTAHRTIAEIARLAGGEVLLVHGATGAFGLAALQVAQACGARVFATAGTEAKRSTLRALGAERTFDSRSLDFVDQVHEATGGRGVDVVINTLTVDGLRANLEVAAEGARVVDIGKRDIAGGGLLPLEILDRNVTLSSFDLDYFARDRGAFLTLGERVLARMASGDYRPLPTTTFPAADVHDALGTMARAGHVGKLVVDLADTRGLVCREPRRPAGPMRADRLYVVSGGTGGVGLQIARWLADRGARALALFSRRGYVEADGQAIVAGLRADGVDVRVGAVDVTDPVAVPAFLDELRAAGHEIGGVVHAAGISHDRPLLDLTPDDVHLVFDPKLAGAQVLHDATRDDPIDLFLLTSSVSSLTGTSGQAAYAAANAGLEAFAQWRRRQGLPATAVGLGPVAEVGMAVTARQIERYVELLGFTALPLDRLPGVFDRVLAANRPTLAVFDLDWRAWGSAEPHAAASPRFTHIRAQADVANSDASLVRARLAAMPQAKRIEALAGHVRDALASALGVEASKLDSEAPLTSLGLDSLMYLEAQTILNHTLGTELTLMGFLGMDSITEVATHISETLAAD